MKKWISLLLCLVMMLSLLPAAIADDAQDEPALTESAEEPAAEESAEEPEEEPAEEPEDEPAEEPAEEPVEEPEEEPVEEPVEEPEEEPAFTEPAAPEQTTDGTPDVELSEGDEKATVYINSKNFPDSNFREWVIANIAGGETSMTQAKADSITTIDCSGQNISKLTGISVFKNLSVLCCNDNKLETLDLRYNKKLTHVECEHNALTRLYLSGCPSLTYLACDGNKLTSLDLSANKSLKKLYADDNRIRTLYATNVKSLKYVKLSNNQLTSLDSLKNNTKLISLYANGNKLKTLTLTTFTKLEKLHVSNNSLTKIDLSKNTLLTDLVINGNDLTAIDITKNTQLETFDASSNKLEKINLTKCTNLKKVALSGNKLTKLNVTKNTKLTSLACNGNKLTKINVKNNTDLVTLDLNNNDLTGITLTYNTKLKNLYLSGNAITKLTLTALTKLVNLDCSNNKLTALKVSANTKLVSLNCAKNKISKLNIASNTKLQKLYCQNNRIKELDPTSNSYLTTLNCSNNCLRALHLSSNPVLSDVSFSGQNTVDILNMTYSGGKYILDMTTFLPVASDKDDVKAYSNAYPYDKASGKMTFESQVSEFMYKFKTGKGDMVVNVERSFNAAYDVAFANGEGTDVIYTGYAICPAFTVKDADGNKIPERFYEYEYVDNKVPGIASLKVNMVGHTETTTLYFKISLPATEELKVSNVATGIKLSWKEVKGATGYVIYRRELSALTSGKWTKLKRQTDTTSLKWTDTSVDPCTKYDYVVKAYYSDATDNDKIGVGTPKTRMVRITTRSLTSLTAGASKLTVKWGKDTNYTGYEIQLSTDPAFKKNIKTVTITDTSKGKTTVTGLKAKTMYYVRIRSYHEYSNTNYYGEWSNVLNKKTN